MLESGKENVYGKDETQSRIDELRKENRTLNEQVAELEKSEVELRQRRNGTEKENADLRSDIKNKDEQIRKLQSTNSSRSQQEQQDSDRKVKALANTVEVITAENKRCRYVHTYF